MLPSMGSRRVGHDLATEQRQCDQQLKELKYLKREVAEIERKVRFLLYIYVILFFDFIYLIIFYVS